MKRIFKRKNKEMEAAAEPQAEHSIMAVIEKIQQQLNSLEAKIDTLISQPGRPQEKPFQRPRRFDRGGRDSFRERSFTKAICADCGNECELPFKPTGDRPVYCKECFVSHKEDRGQDGFKPRGRKNFGRRKGRG